MNKHRDRNDEGGEGDDDGDNTVTSEARAVARARARAREASHWTGLVTGSTSAYRLRSLRPRFTALISRQGGGALPAAACAVVPRLDLSARAAFDADNESNNNNDYDDDDDGGVAHRSTAIDADGNNRYVNSATGLVKHQRPIVTRDPRDNDIDLRTGRPVPPRFRRTDTVVDALARRMPRSAVISARLRSAIAGPRSELGAHALLGAGAGAGDDGDDDIFCDDDDFTGEHNFGGAQTARAAVGATNSDSIRSQFCSGNTSSSASAKQQLRRPASARAATSADTSAETSAALAAASTAVRRASALRRPEADVVRLSAAAAAAAPEPTSVAMWRARGAVVVTYSDRTIRFYTPQRGGLATGASGAAASAVAASAAAVVESLNDARALRLIGFDPRGYLGLFAERRVMTAARSSAGKQTRAGGAGGAGAGESAAAAAAAEEEAEERALRLAARGVAAGVVDGMVAATLARLCPEYAMTRQVSVGESPSCVAITNNAAASSWDSEHPPRYSGNSGASNRRAHGPFTDGLDADGGGYALSRDGYHSGAVSHMLLGDARGFLSVRDTSSFAQLAAVDLHSARVTALCADPALGLRWLTASMDCTLALVDATTAAPVRTFGRPTAVANQPLAGPSTARGRSGAAAANAQGNTGRSRAAGAALALALPSAQMQPGRTMGFSLAPGALSHTNNAGTSAFSNGANGDTWGVLAPGSDGGSGGLFSNVGSAAASALPAWALMSATGGRGGGAGGGAHGHSAGVTSVSYAADAGAIVSAGLDRRVLLWDALTQFPTAVLPQSAQVTAVAANAAAHQLVVVCAAKTVRMYDTRTMMLVESVGDNARYAAARDGEGVTAAALDQGGQRFYLAGHGRVSAWPVRSAVAGLGNDV